MVVARSPSDGSNVLVLIEEDPHRRCVEIIELAAPDRPEECPHGAAKYQEGEGYQQVEDAHWIRLSRKAFKTTTRELVLMPIAAAQGGT